MDIRVIELTDILPITKIEKTNLQTPSIKITGSGYLSTLRVMINNVKSPSFAVLNDNVIVAEIPNLKDRITNVVVYGRNATDTNRDAVLEVGLSDSIGITTGMSKLVQRFVKVLLTRKGSSLFHPEMGTRFRDLQGIGINQKDVIKPLITQTVEDAERYLLNTQSSSIPKDERLLRVVISDISYNVNEQSISISVMIYNANNETIRTSVEV